MKVLLIRPPYTRLKGFGQSPYFPLGLGYIAAVLRDNGFEVKLYHAENPRLKREDLVPDAESIFDFRSQSHRRYLDSIKNDDHYVWKEVEETLASYRPDMVGISLLSVEVASALKISQICKKYNEKCKVVWGGLHPSFLTDECLMNKEVDFVIRGEGEFPMLELCRTLDKGGKLTAVESLSFRADGQIVHVPLRASIANLDDLPMPARDSLLYPESYDFKSFGSMIISRGCPFRCSFCSSRNFWDKKVRFRSPDNIINEIQAIQRTYGTKHIMFWDDSFTINKTLIMKYLQAILDAGIKINWKTATRADLIDEELLGLMAKSGCVKLEIGVESGSDRIKKLINKDVTNDQIKRSFELINRSGIGSGAFFMAGFPEETKEDLDQTFQLMKELNDTELAFNVFDPMPGSSEYEKCISLGLVPEHPDWNDFPFWPDAHYVRDISREDFTEYANMIAKWLFTRNNSFQVKFKRNRQLFMTLLRNDPQFLMKKIYQVIKRRTHVRTLKGTGGISEGK
jgi:anaerobic magnesium-protoporphyrin IX monomethyl ester cyclase